MRKFFILSYLLLFVAFHSHSQTCDDVSMKVTVKDANECDKEGSITITLSNIPANLEITEYSAKLVSGGQLHTGSAPNPNIITGLKGGVYEVKIHGKCSGVAFSKTHNPNVEIKTKWTVPEMKLLTGSTRKTLNCLNSGAFTFSLKGGSAPYIINITEKPAEYTGALSINVATSGDFQLEGLPAGDYNFTLKDNCSSESPTGKNTISKTSTDAYTNLAYIGAEIDNCSKIILSMGSGIDENQDYWYKGYYEIAFSEDGGNTLYSDNISIDNLKVSFDLRENTYKYYYTNPIKIYFRIKGGTCDWKDIPSKNFILPCQSPNITNYTSVCDVGINVVMYKNTAKNGLSNNGYGFCFPYKCTIKDIGGTVLVSKDNLEHTTPQDMGTFPNGKYTVEILSSDGHLITKEVTLSDAEPIISPVPIVTCSTEGLITSVQLYKQDNFPIGTKISYVEGSYLGEIPPFTTTTPIKYLYPLNVENPLVLKNVSAKLGTHKIRVEYCNVDKVLAFTLNEPEPAYITATVGECYLDKVDFRIAHKSIFGIGSRVEFISGPQAPMHTNIVTTATTNVINPFADNPLNSSYVSIVPGTYKFKVYNISCDKEVEIEAIVPKAHSYKDFSFELTDTTCSGIYVKPSGKIVKSDGSIVSAKFNLTGYTNPDGSYDNTWHTWADKSIVDDNGKLLLAKSGTYTLQLFVSNASNCNFINTKVEVGNIFPTLDKSLTASYVCGGSSAPGYIKFVASGGFGNGPYEYTLLDQGTVVEKNMSGVFRYGEVEKTYNVVIVDSSLEAKSCPPKFEDEFKMVDLTNPIIAYTSSNNVCETGTIDLNCITLGITEGVTKYYWTGPNGFAQEGQFITLPNATENMSGKYTVTVEPEYCGTEIKDELNIKVNKLPLTPNITNTNIDVCFNSYYKLNEISGAIIPAGDSLIWYDKNNKVVKGDSTIRAQIAGEQQYTVIATNKIYGCESSKVNVKVTVLENMGTIFNNLPTQACPGSPLIIELTDTKTTLLYRITVGTDTIAEAQGNGGLLSINAGVYPNTNTNYYAEAENNGGCISLKRIIPIAVKIQALGTNIDAKDVSLCEGVGSTELKATITGITVTNPIIRWYASATSTTPLQTDNATTSTYQPIGFLDGVNFYYVTFEADGICENIISKKEVRLNISKGLALKLVSEPTSWEEGAIIASGYKGIPPYMYKEGGGAWVTTNRFENLLLGSYVFTVKDSIGCEHSETASVKGINSPNIVLQDSCSFNPYLTVDIEYSGATYVWEYSTNNTTWNVVSNNKECPAIKTGYYKVKVTLNGKDLVITKQIIVTKQNVLNKTWYNASFN